MLPGCPGKAPIHKQPSPQGSPEVPASSADHKTGAHSCPGGLDSLDPGKELGKTSGHRLGEHFRTPISSCAGFSLLAPLQLPSPFSECSAVVLAGWLSRWLKVLLKGLPYAASSVTTPLVVPLSCTQSPAVFSQLSPLTCHKSDSNCP